MEAGTKVKIGPLLFFHVKNTEPIRFGVVVSKKVSKKAVDRNYLRRLILEIMAGVLKEKSLTGNGVAVVLYQSENPKADFEAAINKWVEKL